MMNYTVHPMPDGTVEVLQSDGGEEILGRLTFRDFSQLNNFLYVTYPTCTDFTYTDRFHTGGKYLCQKQ